jgi:crossover junction endodeoxyribonuclease RuvC
MATVTIGIDPGTLVTGYGIIRSEGSRHEALDYGCIKPPSKMKLTDRYLVIYQGIEALLDKFYPDALAVETQYVQKNPQSALKLGMARGVVIVAAKQRVIPVYEYSPSKAKLAVVGRGHASKFQVQGMVQMLLNLSRLPQPEDAADALALALCHAQAQQNQWNYGSEI